MKLKFLPISLLFVANLAHGAVDGDAHHADPYENMLMTTFDKVAMGELDEALREAETLVKSQPNFKLAQLVYGDLLMAKTSAITGFGDPQHNDGIKDLLDEARARWSHYSSRPELTQIPKYLIKPDPRQKSLLVVDAQRSRLFLYHNDNGQLSLVDDYYVTIGKNGTVKWKEGDKRTPIGLYVVTESLDPQTLPDYYGTGAFPLNYPNYWDKRLGRTGKGIWLHGNPLSSFSRAPRASDGCVTLPNLTFDQLKKYIDVGNTPVIIADGVEWVSEKDKQQLEQTLSSTVTQWQKDWESRDTDRYLSHYSPEEFTVGRLSFAQWAQSKRQINAGKAFIDVEISNMSIFLYPGPDQMAVVRFDQSYKSDNFSASGPKEQYWKQENGVWKIIYEGPPT